MKHLKSTESSFAEAILFKNEPQLHSRKNTLLE